MGKNMMKPRKGLSEKEKHSSQCENFFFFDIPQSLCRTVPSAPVGATILRLCQNSRIAG